MAIAAVWFAATFILLLVAGVAASRLGAALAGSPDPDQPPARGGFLLPTTDPRVRQALRPYADPRLERLRRQMLAWAAAVMAVIIGGPPLIVLAWRVAEPGESPSLAVVIVVAVISVAAAWWGVRAVWEARGTGTSTLSFLARGWLGMLIAFVGVLYALWL